MKERLPFQQKLKSRQDKKPNLKDYFSKGPGHRLQTKYEEEWAFVPVVVLFLWFEASFMEKTEKKMSAKNRKLPFLGTCCENSANLSLEMERAPLKTYI